MRIAVLFATLVLTACSGSSDVRTALSRSDLLMNRPNTDVPDARFRMQSNGSGTVEFLGGSNGAQPVGWSLRGNHFCLTAEDGLIASFGCAKISIYGGSVLLSHLGSDSTATGVLVPRPR